MHIQRQHIQAIQVAATGTTREICGVLLGRRGPRLVVSGLVAGRNVHPLPQRHFLLDAQSLLRADTQARTTNAAIVGFYHSHPSGGAFPSAHDRRDAWPGYLYLIVAVEHGVARACCAWICHADGTFRPEAIALLQDDRV